MYPQLYRIGPLILRTYGLFLAISFILGVVLAVRRGKSRGVNSKDVVDLCFVIMVSSIIGSRLYYVLTHLNEYSGNFFRVFSIWEGGLSMFGGVVLALIASKLFLDRRGLAFPILGDIVAPSLMLGTAVTRIGCFMNGCCFGVPTESALGVVFPHACAAGSLFPQTPIHPTQLYSSLIALFIFLTLLVVDRKKKKDGFLFGLMFVLYSTGRIIIDELRYYEEGSIIGISGFSFTYNQLVSIALIITGLYFMFHRR
ncbi:MAG: prolipoprotein diacylglyceryl transferase [Candidatus Glassbacteria bacterium]